MARPVMRVGLAAIAQQLTEARRVLRRGDYQHLPHARERLSYTGQDDAFAPGMLARTLLA